MKRHHLPGLALATALLWIVTASVVAGQRAVPRGSQGGGPSPSGSGGGSSAPQGARPPSAPRSGPSSESSSSSASGIGISGPDVPSSGGARPRNGQYVSGAAVNRPPLNWNGYYPVGYPGGYYPTGYYPIGYYPWGYGGFGFGVYFGYGGFYGGFYNPWFYGFYGYPAYPVAHVHTVGPDASLHLKVKPDDAEVYVDGYFAGAVGEFDGTFQRLHVEPGPHRIEVRAPGYEPLMLDVRILPDRSVTYEGDLKKQ